MQELVAEALSWKRRDLQLHIYDARLHKSRVNRPGGRRLFRSGQNGASDTSLSDCEASLQSGLTVVDEAEHGEVGARSDRRLNRALLGTVFKFMQMRFVKKTALYIAQLPALYAPGEFQGEILRQRILLARALSANWLADALAVFRISLSELNRDLVGP